VILSASDIVGLETIAARAWPAVRIGRLGGWRLHASSGFSGRINACWPLEDPGLSLAQALTETETWYAEHRLPPRFKIVAEAVAPRDLAERLEARGYRSSTETVMMIGPAAGRRDPAVRLAETVDDAFMGVFAATSAEPGDADERLATLRRVPRPRALACLSAGGGPASIGACAAEGEWAGVFAMRTHAAHRRKGLARRVFGVLLAWAANQGVSKVWLQVEADNTPALTLYAAAGFEEAYRYRYWGR
jgi:GNAT superfamily N-acetyltransferase